MCEYVTELFLEEMPPADIDMITKKLGPVVRRKLKESNVTYESVEVFCTSRRFGFFVHGIRDRQNNTIVEKKGPSQKVAYKDGKPTKAFEGFLKSNNATPEETEIVEINGIPYVFLKKEMLGHPTEEVLSKIVPEIFRSLKFKRPMRYGDGKYRYVRPLHSVLSLMDDKVVEFEFMGKRASNITKSHRYLEEAIEIKNASEYESMLKEKMVIIHVNDREMMIESAISKSGLHVVKDDDLVHEVALITEYPQPVMGEFREQYLNLPEPVLRTVLRHHQHTFITHKNDKISKKFLTFQDGPTSRSKNVKVGYERVINARLADADFYYREDTSIPFERFNDKLEGIAFQRGLGTIRDKVERIKIIAEDISRKLEIEGPDLELIKRAAFLSKADLATSMIYEFPELQGIMGRIYASRSDDIRVALALEEQYLPDGLEGEIPSDLIGAVVGIADRLDTVVANFTIGEIPSGSKDPYGLRKKVFAILRILNSFEWDLNIEKESQLVESLLEKEFSRKEFSEFFKGRLEVILRECYSISQDTARTVLELWRSPLRARLAAQTIDKYRKSEDFDNFIVAYTRVHNISSKYDSNEYHVELFEEKEKPLFTAYMENKTKIEDALDHLNYTEAFEHLKSLKPFIDDYFDKVYVMATQEDLRRNRLGFLKSLDELFLKFGSLSLLSK